MKKILAAIAATLALTACGDSGPTQSDVRDLLLAEWNEVAPSMAILASDAEVREITRAIENAKLLGCEKDKSTDVYHCDVETTSTSDGVKETTTDEARFIKRNDRWRLID